MELKRGIDGFKSKWFLLAIVFVIVILVSNFVIAAETKLDSEQEALKKKLLEQIANDPTSVKYIDFLKDDAVAKEIIKNHLKELTAKKDGFFWFQNLISTERKDFFDKYYNEFESSYDKLTGEEKTDLFFGKDKNNAALMDKEIKEKIYSKFLSGFKQLKPEDQAKWFYDKTSKGDFIIDNEYKNKIWKDLEEGEANSLFKSVNNRAFKNLYGKFSNGNYPELQSVSLKDKNSLIWDGNKITGEKGGYINLMRNDAQKGGYSTDDTIDSRVIGVSYENGKFSEKIMGGRTVEFSQGTAADGMFIGKDGRYVGGDKDLYWDYYRNDANGKLMNIANGKESIISLDYNEKGEALIKLDGNDYDNTLARVKDVMGNNVYFGFNKDNIEADGTVGNDKPVMRIDSDNVMFAQSAEIRTVGYGIAKVSNKEDVALIGNFFNEPGAGPKSVALDILKTAGSKYAEQMIQAGNGILADASKKMQEAITKAGELPEVTTYFENLKKAQQMAPLSDTGKQIGSAISSFGGGDALTNYVASAESKTIQGLTTDFIKAAASYGGYMAGAAYATLSTEIATAESGLRNGISQEIENIESGQSKVLQATFEELSHPEFEAYAANKQPYLSIEVDKNPLAGLKSQGKDVTAPFVRVAIGGDAYTALDLRNSAVPINVLTVNSKGTNGENVYVVDGNSLLTFDNGKTLINNKELGSSVYSSANYNVPIDRIYNENSPNQVALELGKDINGKSSIFTVDTSSDTNIPKSSIFVKGSDSGKTLINKVVDRFTAIGMGKLYAGGITVENPPVDPNSYAGDNPKTDVKIGVDVEKIEDVRLPGPRGRLGPIRSAIQSGISSIGEGQIKTQAEKASMPTTATANMMSSMTINEMNNYVNKMSYSGVDSGMNIANQIANDGKITDPSQVIPGFDNRLKDYAYVWTHPEAFDETMQALSNAGQITKGNPLTLTMNDGMYLGGTKIQGTDPVVTRVIASQIVSMNSNDITLTKQQGEQRQTGMQGLTNVYSLSQFQSYYKSGNSQGLQQMMSNVKTDLKKGKL